MFQDEQDRFYNFVNPVPGFPHCNGCWSIVRLSALVAKTGGITTRIPKRT